MNSGGNNADVIAFKQVLGVPYYSLARDERPFIT